MLITVIELKSSFGLCSIFKQFFSYSVRISWSLSERICKTKFKDLIFISLEELGGLEMIKEKLISAQVLAVRTFRCLCNLCTDNRAIQFGCLLLQKLHDGTKNHCLLALESYRPRKEYRHDVSCVSHRYLASGIIRPMFRKMPIHPQDVSQYVTQGFQYCWRNG